ncbi:hypothetical protein T8S45_03175 [Blastomonas marina]|uniref:hypothetical protein n=1 Tax=Blastomonas marina TaxID=1867408 RepID=UPI002AC9C7F8|nr:hypothetical protein [Blastomonas marina]WPZ04556.1 hypothetical protein T8S45_03175 [Blastomonas marina]
MPEQPPETAPDTPPELPATEQRPHSPRGTLPAFISVPRQKDRANGWKPDVQRSFIEALADTGSVKAACRKVGRAEVGAYILRRHPEAASFRAAWQAALDLGMQRIEDVAMDRALNGVEVPVYSYGKLVGARTVYNDRLLMFMLRNRAPERFGAQINGGKPKGRGAIGKMEKRRLKRKWRAEWEAEKKNVSPGEVYASIERKVEKLREQVLDNRRRDWARLSDEARQAFVRYTRLRARDLGEEPDIPFFLLPHEGDPTRENWWDAPEDWLLTRRDRWQREAAERAAEGEEGSAALPPPDWRRGEEPEVEDQDERAAVVRRLKDRRWR